MKHQAAKKVLGSLGCAFLLIAMPGCMTISVVNEAQGEKRHSPASPDESAQQQVSRTPKRAWAYYILVPITIPLDVVTSPFQLLMLATWDC